MPDSAVGKLRRLPLASGKLLTGALPPTLTEKTLQLTWRHLNQFKAAVAHIFMKVALLRSSNTCRKRVPELACRTESGK